ncbi:uncharacterized protein [Nicotiana tomentosiformis]|uniref:uncharacterized protein n=1 Tax=Nicotiana tomentosiformis TaxID=4098 RepID=UPI00388C3729
MDTQMSFIVTFVYAKCDSTKRIELWDRLYAIARDMSLPWLVRGYFNVIWDKEERIGGLSVHMNEVLDFRHCVNTCNLFDLVFKGSIYTWWNGRGEDDCIFQRLDRCLANVEFQQMFARLEITHLSKIGSDHRPMMLSLKKVKKALLIWSKDTYGNIFQNIASLEEVVLVHEVQFELNHSFQNRERLMKVQAEFIKYLALEE